MTDERRGGPEGSAEALFGILADQSPNMIFIHNLRRIVFVNTRCAELTGYSADELCSDDFHFLQLIAPEDHGSVGQRLAAHRDGQDVAPYSYRLVTRDGRRIDVVNSTRLISYHEQPAILGVVTDLSEVKRARRALAESEARYHKLVELLPDGVAVTDLEGNLLVANQQLARILGYDSREALEQEGRATIEQVSPEQREQALAGAADIAGAGGVRCSEATLLRRDGSPVEVEIAHSLLTDETLGPTGFIRVVRDITDRKRGEALERRMRQAQRLESLGVLAGGIAHDFNNLLMGVMGNASLALHHLPEGSPAHRCVEQIDEAASRAAELTRQLLAYSGKGSVSVQPVVLSEFVQGMGELLRVSLPKKAALDYRFEQPTVVRVDTAQLHQVLMNLIINAGEALGDRPGTVLVRAGQTAVDRDRLSHAVVGQDLAEGTYALLEVSDTGCGMSAATLERMFDPFYTTKGTGRGLGLAAVLGIVRGHRGAMWVESAPGEGTTVRIVLPLASAAPGERARLPGIVPPGKGTILLVDDESVVRTVGTRMLEKLGYEVVSAACGAEAIELLKTEGSRIRAALLDLTMPDLNGHETLARLREIRADLPVLLSSGYDEQEVAKTLDVTGQTRFLQKPYRPAQLAEALKVLLEG